MGGDRVDFFVSHAGRDGAWAEWVAWQLIDAGYSVELDVWDWAAGRNFVTAMSEALARADRVVAALGDLPLAIAQAAGYLAETGMPAGQYAALVGPRAAQLLGEGRPPSYPRSLAAVTVLALDRLAGQDPAAAEVAGVCAFLAPEPVPAEWFPGAAAQLPAVLAGKAGDPVAWRQVLGQVSRSALARADPGGLLMHRLTQAIIRSCLPSEQATASRAVAEVIVAASSPDDLYTLAAGHALGFALRQMGRSSEARRVTEDTVARRRRVLGEDHPDTLTSASNLAADLHALGETEDRPG